MPSIAESGPRRGSFVRQRRPDDSWSRLLNANGEESEDKWQSAEAPDGEYETLVSFFT